MGDQEERILISFEGDDAGATAAIERVAEALAGAVVDIDAFIAAGGKLSDINAGLDGIAGSAGTAGAGMADLAQSMREADAALGAANNILGTTAAQIDALGAASQTGAEELARFNEQVALMAAEQDVALRSLDLAAQQMETERAAASGLGESFVGLDAASAAFGEGIQAEIDHLSAYTMVIDRGVQTTSAFAQEQLSLAERLGAGSAIIMTLADKVTALAIAEGLATSITQELTQASSALADVTTQVLTGEEGLARMSLEEWDALQQVEKAFTELIPQFYAGTVAMDDLAAAGITEARVLQDVARMAALGAVSLKELAGIGVNLDTVNAVLDNIAQGMSLVSASAKVAADGMSLMASAGDKLAATAIAMVESADAARLLAEANAQAAAAAYDMAVAEGLDAGTVGALKMQSEEAAAAVQRLAGAEDESAGSSNAMGMGFGIVQALLIGLAFQALQVGKNFLDMGMSSEEAMVRLQNRTNVNDQQLQVWRDDVSKLGEQYGFVLADAIPALDAIASSGFQASDATDILRQSMQLAQVYGEKLATTTDLLVMGLKAYGAGADQAANYAEVLSEAISHGRQSMSEMQSAIAPVIDEAAQMGIKFEDLIGIESDFALKSHSSMIATRELQSLITAIGTDMSLTSTQAAKLGLSFDTAKFSTLDWAGKLEFLGKISGNNVAEFTRLIGGTDAAKRAMDTLGISTDQLAKNAKRLGLDFNAVTYNTLDAAGKLLYLDQVSGGNEKRLQDLTNNGLHPLNTALANLDLTSQTVGARAKAMGLDFDFAKFHADDLKQKIIDLWNWSNHDPAIFASLIGGAKNVAPALDYAGIKAQDTGGKIQTLGNNADAAHPKVDRLRDSTGRLEEPMRTAGHVADTSGGQIKTLGQKSDDASKTSAAAADRLKAHWSTLADKFNTHVGPSIITVVDALSSLVDQYPAFARWSDSTRERIDKVTQGFDNLKYPIRALPGDFAHFSDSTRTTIDTWTSTLLKDFTNFSNNTRKTIDTWVTGQEKSFTDLSNNTRTTIDTWVTGQEKSFTDLSNNTRKTIDTWVTGQEKSFTDLSNNLRNTIDTATAKIWQSFTDFSNNTRKTIDTWVSGVEQSFRDLATSLIGGSIVPDMINKITQAFSTAGTTWSSTVNTAMSQVIATVQSWVGSATLAGAAVGNAIGDGLNSAVGWVKQAAGNIAGAISSILHHSTPEEGPLRGDDLWGQHFGDAFADGMTSSIGKLRTASLQMASSVGLGLGGSASGLSPLSSTSSSGLLGQILATLQAQGRAPILGSAPTPASLPSVTQQIGSVNISGVHNLQTLYNQLNALAGVKYENAARGAINP